MPRDKQRQTRRRTLSHKARRLLKEYDDPWVRETTYLAARRALRRYIADLESRQLLEGVVRL